MSGSVKKIASGRTTAFTIAEQQRGGEQRAGVVEAGCRAELLREPEAEREMRETDQEADHGSSSRR